MDHLNCECCDTRIHFENAYGYDSELGFGTTTFLNEGTGLQYTAENESICQDCGDKHNS